MATDAAIYIPVLRHAAELALTQWQRPGQSRAHVTPTDPTHRGGRSTMWSNGKPTNASYTVWGLILEGLDYAAHRNPTHFAGVWEVTGREKQLPPDLEQLLRDYLAAKDLRYRLTHRIWFTNGLRAWENRPGRTAADVAALLNGLADDIAREALH